MPWRFSRSPYKVLVSEIMLQQTGINRVMAKYGPFLRTFPTIRHLAQARVAEVLHAWKGLGYNRRALALLSIAGIVCQDHGGRLPRNLADLLMLPGIGRATASALLVYAFNMPVAFVETNVRRVYLHYFFPGETGVTDARILPLVEATMDRVNPREWFYALMDYGTMLAETGENANTRSARYRKQAAFEGSVRQMRGKVLEVMLALGSGTRLDIVKALGGPDRRLDGALQQLVKEGFLHSSRGRFSFR
jgi:A/G-specific adenine glycosylase